MPKNKKLALNSGIQTNQMLTNDDEVCIPHFSSILLAVPNSVDLMKNLLRLTGSWLVACPSASIHCSTSKSSPGWPFPFPFSHSSFPASWPPSTRWHSTTTWTKFYPILTTYPPHRGHFLLWTWPRMGIFWTNYPPYLVHVVIECPLQVQLWTCGSVVHPRFTHWFFHCHL